MNEAISAALTALGFLSPYLVQFGSKLVEKANDKGSDYLVNNAGSIYGFIKNLLPDNELITLNLLEKNPESKDLQKATAEVIAPHLEKNPEKLTELLELLKNLPQKSGDQVHIEQTGDFNIAFGVTHGGTFNINKDKEE